MADIDTKPPPPFRLEQFSFTLLAFAALFTAAVFGALASEDADFFRLTATDWMAALLAMPALFQFVQRQGRRVLDHWWRLFWTFGWLMLAVHALFAFGLDALWRPWAMAADYGWWLTGGFYAVLAVWLADVVMAWNRLDWADAGGAYRKWQRLAAAVVVAAFLVMLVGVGADTIGRGVGVLLVLAVAVAFLMRVNEREQGR